MTVQQITDAFVDRVGVDGCADIKRAATIVARVIWIVLVLIAWCMVLYQTISSLIKFFNYEKTTTIELKFDNTSEFPAITFCNLNPLKYSQLSNTVPNVDELLSQDSSVNPILVNPGTGNWSTQTDSPYDYDGPDESGTNPDMPDEIKVKRMFYEELYKLNATQRKSAGHTIYDMLLDCTFQDAQCHPSDFVYSSHPIFGNCYTFNAGWSEGSSAKVRTQNTSMPGPDYGLSLSLYVEKDEYIPMLASSTGIRLLVHNQTDIPYLEDSGFTVSPGFLLQVELRKVIIKRLGKPYNQNGCNTKLPSFLSGLDVALWPPAKYMQHSCEKFCYQKNLEDKCGCIDARKHYYPNKVPCAVNNTVQEKCRQQAETSFKSGDTGTTCRSSCAQACLETNYQEKASLATWPSDLYMDVLKKTMANRNQNLKQLFDHNQLTEAKNNILSLQVYFERLNYESIVEEVAYEDFDLLNDLGGAVGLWVGMSMLSFVQCAEYICELIKYTIKKRQMSQVVQKYPGTTALTSKEQRSLDGSENGTFTPPQPQ